MKKYSKLTDYYYICPFRTFIFVLLLVCFQTTVKANVQASGAEAKITSLPESKHQSFLDKNLDFFITKHDYMNPKQTPFRYKEIRRFLRERETIQENKADLFIMPNEIIEEEEEKFKKEILNNVIKKEVNIDEYKINENADIFGFPDSRLYENHPVKLLKGNTKIRTFADFPYKITFEPKTLEIVDKPICIPAMFFLNLKNSKSDQLILNNIRSDLYQVTIFFFKGKDGTVFNQKSLYPKLINQGETLILQIVFLPDTVGEIKGNIYFEFTENRIVVFPIKITGIENIYKVEPLYFNNWLGSRLLTQKLNIYNPHNKVLIIKEVINSFSSINLNWPNGSPVNSNSTAIDISMLEIPPKSNQTLLHINFYKEVSGIEYGLLQIKTDRDNLIVPVLIRVEIVGLNAYPNTFNFGVVDLNQKLKRLIPLSIENVSKQNILVKRIYTSFEESLIEVIPIHTSKNNQLVIKPEENISEFIYLMLDPSNYYSEDHEHLLYKKIQGNIIIQTNFTENPFLYLSYEYYLDKNTFSYPEKYFDFYYSKAFKQDTVTTYESNFKINSSTNFIIHDIISDSKFIKIDFDRKNLNLLQGNYYDKNFKIELKIDNQNDFVNRKYYYLCVKNFNYLAIIPFKLYDKSLDFTYFNQTMQVNKIKGINIIAQKQILDLGSISSVEMNKRLYNITNDNPEEIIIVDIEHSGITINLEYITYLNKYGYEENIARIHRVLKKQIDKRELNLSIPGNSVVSFSFLVNTAADQDINSLIKFQFERKISFQLTLKFKILKGNLNITPSVIRFEPAFPGLFQHKLISSKSSYNLPVQIKSVSSKDPRIQPVLMTNTIVSNNRTEIMKVIFDPSKVPIEDNFMKGEFFVNTTSKYISYKELYLWKEKQRLWELLGSQGKSEINTHINIQTNIQSEKVNVRAFLTKPSLVKKDEIDFGLIHIGESVKTEIEIFNPSDEPISIQIILAPEEFADIHNNSMFAKNRKFRYTPSNSIILMDCCFYNSTSNNYFVSNSTNVKSKRKNSYKPKSNDKVEEVESLFNSIIIEEDINMHTIRNFTKNDIMKKLFLFANQNMKSLMVSSDRFICSPTFLRKNEIITNNYKQLMEMIFSDEFNKDINIVKKMTDANPPAQHKHQEKYSLNFIEKIGYYLKLFFKIENNLKFRRKIKPKRKQEIYIPKSITNSIYVIKPHQKIKIGPIYYHPNNSSNYSATLFIKNNLTILYPLKIKGMGGSGLLEFYSNETNNNQEKVVKKIEKLLINIDSISTLNQLENNNDKIYKNITLKNSGNLPLKIYNISIENAGCEGFGISLSRCSEISLNPHQSINLEFAITPNFNFYLLEKNIIFQTHYQKITLKVSINISDEILAARNRLFNTNIGGLSFLVIGFIITLIVYILSKEYNEMNSSSISKKSIIFISPKEIIEKNPILKIENLLLKTYRRVNKKIYEDINIKQFITGPTYTNPIENEKKKPLSSRKEDHGSIDKSSVRKERKITEDTLSNDNKNEQKLSKTNIESKEIPDENKNIQVNQNPSVSNIQTSTNIKKKGSNTAQVTSSKKPPKPSLDKNKPKTIGMKQDKFEKTPVVEVQKTVSEPSKPVIENVNPVSQVKDQTTQFNKFGSKEEFNYGISNYNQPPFYNQEAASIYNNTTNNAYNRNYQFNKFSYNKAQDKNFGRYQPTTGYQEQNNTPYYYPPVQQTSNIPSSQSTEKLDSNIKNIKENIETKPNKEEQPPVVNEPPKKEETFLPEKKSEADELREQYNNFQMGFKLGGDTSTQTNQQSNFSNPKTVLSEKINEEANVSSQLENSELDDDKNAKFGNLDEESVHYQSEREKLYEESGTEDKREDIKLNFNSIFGYHSNVKIITNDEKDQAEENPDKEENTFGGGLYFNEKFFTNFDKVFKKPDPFGFNNVMTMNSNPFVSDNNKVSALNELRDDDDDKFNLDDLNDDKNDKADEIENDDDEEKDPEWDDENMDLKKEGFFDETGTYKLKQIDFNFDLDMKRIKR